MVKFKVGDYVKYIYDEEKNLYHISIIDEIVDDYNFIGRIVFDNDIDKNRRLLVGAKWRDMLISYKLISKDEVLLDLL